MGFNEGDPTECTILSWVDGDSGAARRPNGSTFNFRLEYTSCPELNGTRECSALEAANLSRIECPVGSKHTFVRFGGPERNQDDYGRYLRTIVRGTDGVNHNLELLGKGLANTTKQTAGHPKEPEAVVAMYQAKVAELGLWKHRATIGHCAYPLPPMNYAVGKVQAYEDGLEPEPEPEPDPDAEYVRSLVTELLNAAGPRLGPEHPSLTNAVAALEAVAVAIEELS